jgi:hypothetical protein
MQKSPLLGAALGGLLFVMSQPSSAMPLDHSVSIKTYVFWGPGWGPGWGTRFGLAGCVGMAKALLGRLLGTAPLLGTAALLGRICVRSPLGTPILVVTRVERLRRHSVAARFGALPAANRGVGRET